MFYLFFNFFFLHFKFLYIVYIRNIEKKINLNKLYRSILAVFYFRGNINFCFSCSLVMATTDFLDSISVIVYMLENVIIL